MRTIHLFSTSIDKYEEDTQISLFDTAIPAQELKEM